MMAFRNKSRGTKIVMIIVLVAIFVTVMSLVVMALWNVTISPIFSLPEITIWQALGLLILSKLLFSGFRPGFRKGPPWRHVYWKRKWMDMSEEERENFRRKWRERCGRARTDYERRNEPGNSGGIPKDENESQS